ncbi:MAG: bifunctional nuclease family protein [Gemmatimonadales bacterium]
MWIGPAEASAIAMEMQGIRPPRPMTHDLLKSVIVGLEAQVQRIVISALKDKTYFAQLWLAREEHMAKVDARPSDSIALALRVSAAIFTDPDLLEEGAEEGHPARRSLARRREAQGRLWKGWIRRGISGSFSREKRRSAFLVPRSSWEGDRATSSAVIPRARRARRP